MTLQSADVMYEDKTQHNFIYSIMPKYNTVSHSQTCH